MKHKRFGFTLVEITLFLAITGALFVGIIIGTQNSIRSQRYNDSVQNFANFWRDIYASVSNTQNLGDGRSNQAIYGRLVVFGETVDLNGNAIESSSGQKVFYYDVIGNVARPGIKISNSTLDALKNSEIQANIVFVQNDGDKVEVFPSGLMDSYTPTWGATIEDDKTYGADGTSLFTGSVLVVKHPKSTNISTYFSNEVIEVNELLLRAEREEVNASDVETFLTQHLSSFEPSQIDFCINSDDIGRNIIRRQDVRLIKNANNASGIEILSADKADNPCSREGGV